MNSGKTIFSQLMDFIPRYEFNQCVKRYNGNYKIKNFTCWEQFLCMAFAQLTYRESLRDIQACLRAAKKKLYHMGIGSKVSRNTLAHANQIRDWRIYMPTLHKYLFAKPESFMPMKTLAFNWNKLCMPWILRLSTSACLSFLGHCFGRKREQ